jgi:hypothetical protein
MKAMSGVLAILIVSFMFAGCDEFPANPPQETSSEQRTTSREEAGIIPAKPGPASGVTLTARGEKLILSWGRNPPYTEIGFSAFHDAGGCYIEPEPDFTAERGATSIDVPFPISSYRSDIRFVVLSAYLDTNGTIRWAGGGWSNPIHHDPDLEPGIPQVGEAQTNGRDVTVLWTPTEPYTEDGFTVCSDGLAVVEAAGNGVSNLTIRGLAPGTYRFNVEAFKNARGGHPAIGTGSEGFTNWVTVR